MRKSFGKIADPYPEEDDVRFCELLLKYFKGVIPEPLLSRLKENIPMGAWSIFCTPESFMNLPASPVFPDDKKTSMENNIVASKPKARKEMLQTVGSSDQTMDSSPQVSQSTLSVVKVEGAAKTYPRQKIVYKVTKYNKEKDKMNYEDRNKEIKWAIRICNCDITELENKICNGDITELKNKKGEKITLDIDKNWEGKYISVMAYIDIKDIEEAKFDTEVLKDPYKGTLIRGVTGEDEAFPWQEIEYEVINSNGDGSASKVADGSDVKWAIKVGKDGKIDKEMLGDRRKQKVISLKIEEEWKNNEITIMPYLNSPTETVSVKTKIGTVAKTIYITQGHAIRDYLSDKEINETERKKHIEINNSEYNKFMNYARGAKEKLKAEGFNVVINPCMTEKKYIEMMKNSTLIAYYMDAHGNVNGFSLPLEELNFEDPNWSINYIDGIVIDTTLITPGFFVRNEISRPDLLLVYQISCENQYVVWEPHLGKTVRHFLDPEPYDDGKYKPSFIPERIRTFADEIIEKVKSDPRDKRQLR